MTDENKTKQESGIRSKLKFLLGVLIIFSGVYLTIHFSEALKIVFFGCIGPFLILVGLIAIAISKE